MFFLLITASAGCSNSRPVVVVGWTGRREARERVAMAAALARSRERSATRQQQSESGSARDDWRQRELVWRTHVRACMRACGEGQLALAREGSTTGSLYRRCFSFGVYTERRWLHNTSRTILGRKQCRQLFINSFFSSLARLPLPPHTPDSNSAVARFSETTRGRVMYKIILRSIVNLQRNIQLKLHWFTKLARCIEVS